MEEYEEAVDLFINNKCTEQQFKNLIKEYVETVNKNNQYKKVYGINALNIDIDSLIVDLKRQRGSSI